MSCVEDDVYADRGSGRLLFYAAQRPGRRGRALRRIRPSTRKGVPPWRQPFLAALQRSGLAPLTVRTYLHDVDYFLAWLEESTGTPPALGDLVGDDLLRYRQSLKNVQKLRPATINHRLQAVRWLCRWAHRQGILAGDPATATLKSMKVPHRRRPVGLEEREAHALLRAAGRSGHGFALRNLALVHLLLQTGLRVGEAAALCVGDVKLRSRGGEVHVRYGKGEKEREVPLNASARRALSAYLETRAPDPEDPLFLGRTGERLSGRSVQALIQGFARGAKITRLSVSPHTLRHTFALQYLKQNPGKLVELASLLGHDSLDTTAIYTRPSAEDLAEDLEGSALNVYG